MFPYQIEKVFVGVLGRRAVAVWFISSEHEGAIIFRRDSLFSGSSYT